MFNTQEINKIEHFFFNHLIKTVNIKERKDYLADFFKENPKLAFKLRHYAEFLNPVRVRTQRLGVKSAIFAKEIDTEIETLYFNKFLYYYLTAPHKVTELGLYKHITQTKYNLLGFLTSKEIKQAIRNLKNYKVTMTKTEVLGLFKEHIDKDREEFDKNKIKVYKTEEFYPNIPKITIANLRVPTTRNHLFFFYVDSKGFTHTSLDGRLHYSYIQYLKDKIRLGKVLIGFVEHKDSDLIHNRLVEFKQVHKIKKRVFNHIYHHICQTDLNLQFELFKKGERNHCEFEDCPRIDSFNNFLIVQYSNFKPTYVKAAKNKETQVANYFYQFSRLGVLQKKYEIKVMKPNLVEIEAPQGFIHYIKVKIKGKNYKVKMRRKAIDLTQEQLKNLDVEKTKAKCIVMKDKGKIKGVEILELDPVYKKVKVRGL